MSIKIINLNHNSKQSSKILGGLSAKSDTEMSIQLSKDYFWLFKLYQRVETSKTLLFASKSLVKTGCEYL